MSVPLLTIADCCPRGLTSLTALTGFTLRLGDGCRRLDSNPQPKADWRVTHGSDDWRQACIRTEEGACTQVNKRSTYTRLGMHVQQCSAVLEDNCFSTLPCHMYTREPAYVRGGGGGRGSGTQKLCDSRWPKSKFPFVDFIFSPREIWVQRGWGGNTPSSHDCQPFSCIAHWRVIMQPSGRGRFRTARAQRQLLR